MAVLDATDPFSGCRRGNSSLAMGAVMSLVCPTCYMQDHDTDPPDDADLGPCCDSQHLKAWDARQRELEEVKFADMLDELGEPHGHGGFVR